MNVFPLPVWYHFRFVIIFISVALFGSHANAVTQTFTGPWDPTVPLNGFSLRATQPGSTATMTLGEDLSSLSIVLNLNNCYHGCGAFYLDNSSGALPFGEVQFDWTVSMNDYTTDGQIAIDGADLTVNDGGRDITLYPAGVSGTANIDYEGGTFTFFNVGIGAEWTGTTVAMISISNFSAPDGPVANAAQPSGPVTNVTEPAGWGLLLVGGIVMLRVRRPRAARARMVIGA